MGFFDDIFGATVKERKKKVFISFVMEDIQYRNYLVEQSKKVKSPFEFVDMSAKKPWKQSEWQNKCRTKMKGCDGVIVLLSKNTYHASGVRWEMKCANEEKIKLVGMHIKKNDKGAIPPELHRKKKITWTWNNLEEAIKTF